MGPFDRFNDRAKRVLALAQDEAIRFNHNYIGPEHLLIGLIREGEGVAAHVLRALGLDLSSVRRSLESIRGRGDASTASAEITLIPRSKKIIELAIDEARKLGHSHVGTEHLLLALVREGEGSASGIIESLGVDLKRVREQVVATLAQAVPGGMVAAAQVADPRGSLVDADGKKRDWYCEDVLSGKLKVKVLYEDELVLAFEHPHAMYIDHTVVIPKRHVPGLLAAEALDPPLAAAMLNAVQQVARLRRLDARGFQLQANAAVPGVTPHMHWHVAGPGVPPETRPDRGASPRAAILRPARLVDSAELFSRFDDTAHSAFAFAGAEAIRVNHNYIGTEHLLAGLIRAEDPIVVGVLGTVDLSKVRTALELIIGRGDEATTTEDLTLSPRTKKVLELAADSADRLGRTHVSAALLLLGLVREGQGIASGILESLGLGLEDVRKRIEDALREPTGGV